MKQMPMIEKYMTAMPHTINAQLPMQEAVKLMNSHGIRHLPVQDGGRLVGVLTDRDVKLASSFTDADKLRVEDVMTNDPYTTQPQSALDEVVDEMAEKKFGCAVVLQENGRVVGIFTANDGLRVLGEVLRNNFKPISR